MEMIKCELCGKYLELHEVDPAEGIAWFSCPAYLAGKEAGADEHTSFPAPLTESESIAEHQGRIHDLAVLGNHGWNITYEAGGDISEPEATATRRWNLAEVSSDGDYKSFITDLKADIIDPLYIEYTLDLIQGCASYIYYAGGQDTGNCGIFFDNFEECLRSALDDILFTETELPLKTNTILDSGDKLRPAWFDMVQFEHDFASCVFDYIEAGSFAIRVINNTNTKGDEVAEYYLVDQETAHRLLALAGKNDITPAVEDMIRIVDRLIDERS